jgi:nucleoside-diphosphate-sugar epimerase
MKVIVLGGTGWVGHNIVREFVTEGHDVAICSRGRKTTYEDAVPGGVRRVTGDKQDADSMEAVLSDSYDCIVDTLPTEASIDHVARFAKVGTRYLHCSSTGGYAPLQRIPADETHPYNDFMGGWGQKGIVDAKVMDLFQRQGFAATVLRPSYITGPGLLPLDNLGGRREDFVDDLLREQTLDLPGDGLALLQPVHVQDLARAFVLAARCSQSVGQIYNISLERAVPITRYMELNAEALGRRAVINPMSVADMLEKYGDRVDRVGLHFFATHMCYDMAKARTQLGYVPRWTTEQAIAETVQWAAEKR